DAAHVEAGAAERLLAVLAGERVDAGGLQAQLCGADRSHIAGRAGADDDDIVFFAHGLPLCSFLLPPGEGGAKRRMRVRAERGVAVSPNPHPNPSPGGRGAQAVTAPAASVADSPAGS